MRPAVRISLGVVALTIGLLLVADTALGIFPDPDEPILEARAQLCESLAVQYSSLVSARELGPMAGAMEQTVAQVADVLTIGLRDSTGELVVKTADHERLWQPDGPLSSTPTHVRVPIFEADRRWGTLEVGFTPLHGGGIQALLAKPLYRLIAVLGAAGFAVYLIYLTRTLRYLDPSKVVPGRVRAALDQLVEGALILDEDHRIVLVNSAFAEKVGRTADTLLGVDPASLDWVRDGYAMNAEDLPWVGAKRDGGRRTDVRLELESPTLGLRVLTGNVSPIVDGAGKHRGVLATFDDISDVERMNAELKQTISRLEVAEAEARAANEELFRLATRDPLTGCLNRRALFEKLESEFALGQRDGLALAVVMADIDHFKRINDEFGHAVGDAVIKQMAQVLADMAGAGGVVGRYGGEEFCLLLSGADAEAAADVADRARLALAARSESQDSPTGGRKVTASFGVSSLESEPADMAELLDRADQGLYQSKEGGRNRVTIWGLPDVAHREAS